MARPSFTPIISLGNTLTILSMIVAVVLSWGRMDGTLNEMKLLRENDLNRITRVENAQDVLRERVAVIEKQTIEMNVDLRYIRTSLEDIKTVLKGK